MVKTKDRPVVTCSCGCGRVGRLQNRRTGYVRACFERWRRVGFPESGPPELSHGHPPTTTGAAARKRAAVARDRWAMAVMADHATGPVTPIGPGWQQAAVCRDLDDDWSPDDWFPADSESASDEVLAACDRCPVRRECLLEGINRVDPHSIRAGLTPYQRGRLPGRAARRLPTEQRSAA